MIKKITMFMLVMGILTACGTKTEENQAAEETVVLEEVISEENIVAEEMPVEYMEIEAEENTDIKN